MTDINNILTIEMTVTRAPCESKKSVLEFISNLVEKHLPYISAKKLLEQLIKREKLGSTGVGNGVAIPHIRIKNLTKPLGILLQLQQAIDFEAGDNQPVDLLFGLLVPDTDEDQHLQLLACIAKKFRNAELRQNLRAAETAQQLYAHITGN